ncbi:ABC transporter substrate-binding protein [Caenimonas aquaedulcis]|uniref:ABC transporter substrate-binding protein n=1 Tax=Caenimonas aquaedulcis TaxID=2793270 RepID=A0A931H133_9BURK|nr:helical backbone metal receptor [Caenimonas aquaedulcis]MBG9386620.1 ABC transporter substrate-binding protein [Caenimonas aquaedulcis]
MEPLAGARVMKWLAWLLLVCAAKAYAVRVTDDRGVSVEIATPPQRIVAMLPSLTETVCELGACDRLVGLDDYSNFPPRVAAVPRLGGLEDTNIERLVALKPDLVLLASSSRAVARLEGLGVKVLTLEPKTVADLHRVWLQLGLALGVADAPAAWQRLQAAVDAETRKLPPAMRGTRVYIEVNDGPYAASESSFLGELLARTGAANIVPGRLGPFPKLNPEFVVRADPQVIMISDRDAPAVKARPGWARIRAVHDARVCLFTHEQGDVMVRAGPRMAQAVRLMVDCIAGRGKP